MIAAEDILDELLEEEPVRASTLVIHLDDRTTDFLRAIYAGMGYPVINGRISPGELKAEIKRYDRVYMLGHGGSAGLFAAGYMIDREFGPLLRQKQDGLYIWCHAEIYARREKLSGLVSGMFISEVGEARANGIVATQEEVDASNAAFSKAVRNYLDNGESPHTVKQCYNNAACKITQFNNARLFVMDQGVPLRPDGTPEPEPPPETQEHYTAQDFNDDYEKEAIRTITTVLTQIKAGHTRPAENILPEEAEEAEELLNWWADSVNQNRIDDEFILHNDPLTAVASIIYKTGLYSEIEYHHSFFFFRFIIAQAAQMILGDQH